MVFGKSKPVEWRSDNFKYAFILTAASLIVYLIAFASPYWLQTYVTVPFDFKNMGLWEICLNKYFFRVDNFVTEYDGCYWAYSIELELRRDVFNPGYFVMCQIFSVAVLVILFAVTLVMASIFLRCSGEHKWTYWILSIIMCGLMAIASILLFAIIVTVGAKSGDRSWLPRADLVWLSWGYAFAVLANVLTIGATFYYGKEAKLFWGSKAPVSEVFGFPMFRQGDAAMEPPAESGSVFAY